MVRINLLPPEERIDRNKAALERIRDNAHYLIAMTAVLAFAILGSIQEISIRTVAARIQELESESNAVRPQLAKVRKLEAEKKELVKRLKLIQTLDRGRLFRVKLLDAINRKVPEYMWLTKISETGGSSMTIEGVTFSNLVIAEFMNRLESSLLFSNVDLEVAQRGTIEDQHVVQFTLNCSIHDDESVPVKKAAEE